MPRNTQAPAATGDILRERWPHLFTIPVPLKIGIHRDILAESPRPVGAKRLRRFLSRWCSAPGYLQALSVARARYDLQGKMQPIMPEQPE